MEPRWGDGTPSPVSVGAGHARPMSAARPLSAGPAHVRHGHVRTPTSAGPAHVADGRPAVAVAGNGRRRPSP
jgi:hypothetical protein